MKKVILIPAVCFIVAPAFAQDNTITIIHKDDSKDVVDMSGALSPVVDSVVESVAERFEEKEVAPVVAVEPKAESAEKTVDPKADPVSQPAKKPAKKPEIKPAKKAAIADVKKTVRIPLPGRKPAHAAAVGAQNGGVQGADAPLAPAPPEPGISKERALSLALEIAPPSHEYEVSDRGDVYVVFFKTEGGAFEVLVDRNTGEVLSYKSLEKVQKSLPPGHLPKPINLPR